MNVTVADVFVADLLAWIQSGNDAPLMRALRSPYSGVSYDAALAYVTVSKRAGPLLDAIAASRLALPAAERDALLRFSERVKGIAEDTDIHALFEIRREIALREESAELQLTEPLEAEEATGVRARKTHFSASSLNAYADCERKWYYRYVCSAVDDPGSSASTYGTAFHAALEDFHGEFARPDASLERDMRAKIVGYVNWAFERYRADFDTAVEVELHKRRAQRTAQRYIDWVIAQAKRAPFTVIGRETGTELDLDGFPFVGYIDRLDRDDATGGVSIFDYKTGSIATTAAEYVADVRAFADFQLPFYYWARTAQGDRVTTLALIPLKDALLDVRPVSLEVVAVATPEAKRSTSPTGTIGVRDLERARTRMVEICRDLTSGERSSFPVASDPDACTFCSYKDACVDRPLADREKFGR
ncbi:MAG TPA: PD-(D/E)XK nuclease family protein [Candidatus Baltobacteraceae bacterium]|nr:PD-(D/E)XK nuclease family protein [Candidatus Baltobacteraceae bacterium]